jgi:hypothetical protein
MGNLKHVMAFAPTRSGKGVGMVIPTLLTWPASVVVHDIKGENWQLTAGWRARFSHCLLFDPTSGITARRRAFANPASDTPNWAAISVSGSPHEFIQTISREIVRVLGRFHRRCWILST